MPFEQALGNTSSSRLVPSAQNPHDSDGASTSSIRPRNRRVPASGNDNLLASANTSTRTSPSASPARGTSPNPSIIPAASVGPLTGRNYAGPRTSSSPLVRNSSPSANSTVAFGRGLLQGSWAPSWASVTELASSILGGTGLRQSGGRMLTADRPGRSRSVSTSRNRGRLGPPRVDTWLPAPPDDQRPRLEDVAAGSLAEREAALKAMKTASVLESHDAVNGGLDVAGRFKKRRSDEDLSGSRRQEEDGGGEHLVYLHYVQPADTYAGIVLRYRCREDAFRKANGLWSRDNVQIRKHLLIPVDACEVRGQPCAGPNSLSARVDLLAKAPDASDTLGYDRSRQKIQDDSGSSRTNGKAAASKQQPQQSNLAGAEDEEAPWSHVKWVAIDSVPHPVEIVRVARKALGYFPPRRKKSLHTASTISTPRGSIDVSGGSSTAPIGFENAIDSPRSVSSPRRGGAGSGGRASTTTRSRIDSAGEDRKPAWMRRPGGVGTLDHSVRMPGPERDYLNTWAKRHLPGLNIDSLPSMSIMGSETARFGFSSSDTPGEEKSAAIVESPFEDGREAMSSSQQPQTGLGFDKAAAAVETWLRGAFAKRPHAGLLSPRLGPRSAQLTPLGGHEGDLIELADTNSDDGRAGERPRDSFSCGDLGLPSTGLLSQTSRSDGPESGTLRGRIPSGGWGGGDRNKKSL